MKALKFTNNRPFAVSSPNLNSMHLVRIEIGEDLIVDPSVLVNSNYVGLLTVEDVEVEEKDLVRGVTGSAMSKYYHNEDESDPMTKVEDSDLSETEYLLSTDANSESLRSSISEFESGNVVERELIDLTEVVETEVTLEEVEETIPVAESSQEVVITEEVVTEFDPRAATIEELKEWGSRNNFRVDKRWNIDKARSKVLNFIETREVS